MKAMVVEDTKVLIPNKEHRNFTQGSETIEAETVVYGEPRNIAGLRRGQPWVYKVFYTDKGQIIYLNKIKQMDKVEVSLAADSGQSATIVKMPKTAENGKKKWYGTVIGGLLGFAYAKYKKHDMKKAALYIGIGAAAGYGISVLIESNSKIVVKPSK